MRSSKKEISRRAFLAGPTALAVSGGILPRRARALERSSFFDASNRSQLGEAAVLSTRNCARQGFFQISWLPRLFEADLLLNNPALVREVALRAGDIVAQGSFDASNFSGLELLEIPKNQYGARRVFAITEPLDAVVYLSLAVLTAPLIEAQKIPPSNNVVHSFRFAPSGSRLFDERFTFASYLTAARHNTTADRFVVNCDLANCYGSLGEERIAAALEQCGVDRWQIAYISELLRFWQHQRSPGLPVGSNASSILAEAVLLQVDKLLSDAGVDFVRYVDDFRLFASDEAGARLALQAVSDATSSWGLSLNADKTKILHVSIATTTDDEETFHSSGHPLQVQERRLAQAQSRRSSGTRLYGEILPRNFRRASAQEIRRLREVSIVPDMAELLQADNAPPSQIRRAIRRAVYVGHREFLKAIPSLLVRYPEFAAYVAGALSRASEFVSSDVRNLLRTELAAMLLEEETPDFVAIKLVDLLSHRDYRDRKTLELFAGARSINPRGLCFRAAVDALRRTGGVMPDLYGHFEKMDGWSQRALLADPAWRQSIRYSSINSDVFTARLTTQGFPHLAAGGS